MDNFPVANGKRRTRDFWNRTNRHRTAGWEMEMGRRVGHVYERVTSCRIARLNNCDPPVTSRYKHRTVGGGDGRGKHHLHGVRTLLGAKYRSFFDSIKFIKRPTPLRATDTRPRLTVTRSPRRLLLGETRKAYCETSRFLIKWKAVIDWLSELDTMLSPLWRMKLLNLKFTDRFRDFSEALFSGVV